MNFKKISLFALLIISSKLLMAQAGFDDDVTDFAVPIDGGLSAIVAGAVTYGMYRFRGNKK